MALDIVLPIKVKRVENSSADARSLPESDSQAHQQGYRAGYAEGRLRAQWEMQRVQLEEKKRMGHLADSLQRLNQEFESLLQEHLPDLIHAAVNRVFRNHLFTGEEVTREVTALLHDLTQASRIKIECSPDALADLKSSLSELNLLPESVKWSLKANSSLQPGEFLLKSDLGDVDGRHVSRLRKIKEVMEPSS